MKERKSYIDILKLLAMLFVFLIHTSDRFFLVFIQKTGSALYPLYICIPHLLKTCIPVFLMCSGAVLLGKKESIAVVLKKRFCKMLFILTAASFIIAVMGEDFEISGFLKKLYSSQYETTYWYMYMYLGFMLMLPFVRFMAEKMAEEHYIYMVVLYAVAALLKLMDFFVLGGKYSLNDKVEIFTLIPYVFSSLMGYYMVYAASEKKRRVMIAAGIVFFIAAVISTYAYCDITQDFDKGHVQHFFETFAPLYSVSLFGIMQYLFKCPSVCEKILRRCSSAVLYMMLTEGIFRSRMENIYFLLEKKCNPLLAAFGWILAAYICSLVTAVIFTICIDFIKNISRGISGRINEKGC